MGEIVGLVLMYIFALIAWISGILAVFITIAASYQLYSLVKKEEKK